MGLPADKLEAGNIGTGNTSTLAKFLEMPAALLTLDSDQWYNISVSKH